MNQLTPTELLFIQKNMEIVDFHAVLPDTQQPKSYRIESLFPKNSQKLKEFKEIQIAMKSRSKIFT